MSRGRGRCQRALMAQLEASSAGAMGLDELVEVLEARGWRSDNVIRAARALAGLHEVALYERGPGRAGTRVCLPKPVANPISDNVLLKLLEEAGRTESAQLRSARVTRLPQ